jgi:hypothetical protein
MPAPIAFALRLEEAITGKTIAAPGASAQSTSVTENPEVPAPRLAQLLTERLDPLSPPLAAGPVPDGNAVGASRIVATGPNVGTAPNDARSEGTTQPANTQESVRKTAHSQASAAADDESTNHREQESAPPPQIIAGEIRAQPDALRDSGFRAMTRADTSPPSSAAAEIRDTGVVLHSQPTREISMHLTPAASPSVDITLIDRAGSVHVAVRTSDADLARNLQSGLSDLVHRLEHKGFEAEAWSPGESPGSRPASSNQANGNDSASQRHGKDPRDGAQQGNSGQQNQGRNRPKWVTELEQRLARTNE